MFALHDVQIDNPFYVWLRKSLSASVRFWIFDFKNGQSAYDHIADMRIQFEVRSPRPAKPPRANLYRAEKLELCGKSPTKFW